MHAVYLNRSIFFMNILKQMYNNKQFLAMTKQNKTTKYINAYKLQNEHASGKKNKQNYNKHEERQ